MNTIDLPPDAPLLMESTRAIGYSIETAIADVIDNSIAAKASQVDLDYFPLGKPYISILDNGSGMDEAELIAAMRYGSQSPKEKRSNSDLGRFGLGLKTASLSQCKVLSVISKKGGQIFGCQWNLNYIREVNGWSLILLNKSDMSSMPGFNRLSLQDSGTLVVWQELDRFAVGDSAIADVFRRKTDLIREHLSLVFHRYLSGEKGLKKLDIRMNKKSISYTDPFLCGRSTELIAEEAFIVEGSKIRVQPFILPHISRLNAQEIASLGGKEGLRRSQGFYVYRNKRLLVWGTWFRLMRQSDLTKLARVRVDIPNTLDDLWTLDIKKSTATPPEIVRRNLAQIIGRIAEGSKRTWTYRGKKETTGNIVHLWNRITARGGGVYYEINSDHPLVQTLIDSFPESKSKLDSLLRQISTSLPLNSLYVDLTNDEKLVSENQSDAEDIIDLVKSIVSRLKTIQERHEMIESLKVAEPFSEHISAIDQALMKGTFDD